MTHLERLAGGRSKRLLAVSAALAFGGLLVALAATTRGARAPDEGALDPAPAAHRTRELAAAPSIAEGRTTAPRPPAPPRADDDVELAVPADPPGDPATWSEKEHYEHYLALAREGSLPDVAESVLMGEGPDAEKVALLRALRETDADLAAAWFARVLQELPDESDSPGTASVPAFVVRTLSEEAGRDPVARGILRDATWRPGSRLAPALRRRAASAVAANATADELSGLAADLAGEADEGVRAGVLAALRRHPDPDAVARHFGPLGTEPGDATSERDG